MLILTIFHLIDLLSNPIQETLDPVTVKFLYAALYSTLRMLINIRFE